MFDPQWYRTAYPDVGEEEPLIHYIKVGRAEDRQPNEFFDPAWYRQRYPEAADLDGLQHFTEVGAARCYDPSPLFSVRSYLGWYPDVASSNMNPLAHYLAHGRREKRTISASLVGGARVDETPIELRKRPVGGSEIALFVTHSPDGRLKPPVRHYLESLGHAGIAVTLIVAADAGFKDDDAWLDGLVDGLYVRKNEGWDFACWAHVLRLNPEFYRADVLYWLNDSLIGPVSPAAFHSVLERVRKPDCGLIGLTANYERAYHIQSFFLAFKPEALRSTAFQQFVIGIRTLRNKEDVINAYETRLTGCLEAAGIATAALYQPADKRNPAIHDWKALLDSGCPFLKVAAITQDSAGGEAIGWRDALERAGFAVSIVDQLLAEKSRSPEATEISRPWHGVANNPPHLTFLSPYNYGNGLGVAARGYLTALMHLGFPTNVLPVERPFHIHQRVAPTLSSTECLGAADMALVQINPDAWDALLTPAQAEVIGRARHKVGLFVWESQDVPPQFSTVTRKLSAVWLPSRYCADAFRQISEAPVHVVPYVVPVRPERSDWTRVVRLRQEFGIGRASRVILFSFDASSYIERKNPFALVRAFDQSGLAGAGWRLVLKTKHLDAQDPGGRELLEAADKSQGTLLLNRLFDTETALALLDMADIYASPHASEGFGLTIAEAMSRGKPVVASDFGGCTDFLDESCGFPVRCTPWQLEQDHGPYPRGTIWGRINEDRLTETLMGAAALSIQALADIGAKARARIETQLSPQVVANTMRVEIEDVLAR